MHFRGLTVTRFRVFPLERDITLKKPKLQFFREKKFVACFLGILFLPKPTTQISHAYDFREKFWEKFLGEIGSGRPI